MKIGTSSYSCYGDYFDFLAIGKYIYVLVEGVGYIGFAATPQDAYDLVCKYGEYDKNDILEVIDAAISHATDEKPFTKE